MRNSLNILALAALSGVSIVSTPVFAYDGPSKAEDAVRKLKGKAPRFWTHSEADTEVCTEYDDKGTDDLGDDVCNKSVPLSDARGLEEATGDDGHSYLHCPGSLMWDTDSLQCADKESVLQRRRSAAGAWASGQVEGLREDLDGLKSDLLCLVVSETGTLPEGKVEDGFTAVIEASGQVTVTDAEGEQICSLVSLQRQAIAANGAANREQDAAIQANGEALKGKANSADVVAKRDYAADKEVVDLSLSNLSKDVNALWSFSQDVDSVLSGWRRFRLTAGFGGLYASGLGDGRPHFETSVSGERYQQAWGTQSAGLAALGAEFQGQNPLVLGATGYFGAGSSDAVVNGLDAGIYGRMESGVQAGAFVGALAIGQGMTGGYVTNELSGMTAGVRVTYDAPLSDLASARFGLSAARFAHAQWVGVEGAPAQDGLRGRVLTFTVSGVFGNRPDSTPSLVAAAREVNDGDDAADE